MSVNPKNPKSHSLGLIYPFFFLFRVSMVTGVFACIGVVSSIRQVLRPFSLDLDDLSRENSMLEF